MLKGTSSCPACLSSSRSRVNVRHFGFWLASKPAADATPTTTTPADEETISPEPVASTSSLLPGAPAEWSATPLTSRLPNYPQTRRRAPTPSPAASLANLKSSIINNLEAKRPKHALHLFTTSVTSPSRKPLPPHSLALLNLFFIYDYPSTALEALEQLHSRGFTIPPEVSVKLLRGPAINDLILDSARFATVVEWMEESLGAQDPNDEVQKTTAESLVYTVLEVSKRMRQPQWAESVFKAYRSKLPRGEMGSPRLWALLIRIQGQDGDLATAISTFDEWRALSKKAHHSLASASTQPPPTPPEIPYLSMLQLLTEHTKITRSAPRFRRSRAPPTLNDNPNAPYDFLRILVEDGLPQSTDFFASLLRLELSRRRYSLFWKVFSTMDEVGLRRNKRIWLLAIKARLWEEGPGRIERGHSVVSTPWSFNSRELLRELLLQTKKETNGRQHLNLKLRIDGGAVMTTEVLNGFLKLFIQARDFVAAGVVLECFRVHRIEPNEKTHGIVVVGIVEHWEKGRIRDELEEGRGLLGGPPSGRRRRMGETGLKGVELLRRILESRKMRVRLWTNQRPRGEEAGSGSKVGEETDGEDETSAVPSDVEIETPAWMLLKEMRDTNYLTSLLRRSQGLSEEGWNAAARTVREEVLPSRRTSSGD